MKQIPLAIASALLLVLFAPLAVSAAPAAAPAALVTPGGDRPGGAWDGVPTRPSVRQPEPLWSLRTGIRKGIDDQTLPGEISAAPDAAVLKNGFFPEATVLLADFQESATLVGPGDVAGLTATKPLLVIPSGGLAGFASSRFFRAGLAEYARSGGTVICFAQRRGGDYAALPVPEGSTIEAAGWTEDGGALFRSSLATGDHPILAGIGNTLPSIETDGSFGTLPAGARVLLERLDGRPTLALYPFGKGWIAVTTLFSDVSAGEGMLNDDERILVRNLVLWAKSGGDGTRIVSGQTVTADFTVRGPEQGESSFVKVSVMGPSKDKPVDERVIARILRSPASVLLPFSYTVPAGAPPGIYHLEYALLRGDSRPLGPAAESGVWFVLSPAQPAPRPVPPPSSTVRSCAGVGFSVSPRAENDGDRFRLRLRIARTSGPAGNCSLYARVGGAERYFTLRGGGETVSFDVPSRLSGKIAPYAIYHGDGRAITRGVVPLVRPPRTGVSLDRPWYLPGERLTAAVKGLGRGSISLTGIGSSRNDIVSTDKTYGFSVPASLPRGAYPLSWEFEALNGKRLEGTVNVNVAGTQVRCLEASIVAPPDGGTGDRAARLQLEATQPLSAVVRLRLVSPSGSLRPAAERSVRLAAGPQDVEVPFAFEPDTAGIWQVRYEIDAPLPQGPGYTEAVPLAEGSVLVDAGDALVLALDADRPVYYEPAGGASVRTIVYGTDRRRVDVLLDGKRIARERTGSPGTTAFTTPLDDLAPGPHTVAAVMPGGALESRRDLPLVYGARLADLTVTLKTSDLTAPVLEVGVGVLNQGRAASGPCEASLYDGGPDSGGKLIKTFPVPPLEAGRTYVAIVKWPLAGHAGPHTLTAVVNRGRKIPESNESNDSAAVSFTVPDILLSLTTDKGSYRSDERIPYTVRLANFTDQTFRDLALGITTSDPDGKTGPPETVSIPRFAPGDDQLLDRTLNVASPREGIYLIAARLGTDKVLAADSMGITVLPTLLLNGSFEDTPAIASPCRPFTITYRAGSAGNVPPTNGSLKIEIRSSDRGQVVYAKQVPLWPSSGKIAIGKVEFPRGSYLLTLRGMAVNRQKGLTADLQLAQQPLTVEGPVQVVRARGSVPRVLVWAGGEDSTTIERALADKIVKDAFDGEGVYVKTVSTAQDFGNEAATGRYTVYALIEVHELLNVDRVLKSALTRGSGVVIVGSGDRTRSIAESLGFRFGTPVAGNSEYITFPSGSVIGLTGTLPVSGRILPPRKDGAKPVALFSDGRPAVLLDAGAGGTVVLVPFPITRSALDAGMTSLYSLFLRSAVLAAEPRREGGTGVASSQLLVSSPTGPVSARIAEILPPGAKVLWTSIPAESKNGMITFELTADREPVRIMTLYEPVGRGEAKTTIEVFSECEGRFVSQGKTE